jgi:hypothetical protein
MSAKRALFPRVSQHFCVPRTRSAALPVFTRVMSPGESLQTRHNVHFFLFIRVALRYYPREVGAPDVS